MNIDNITLDSIQLYVSQGKELPALQQKYLDVMEMIRGLYMKYEKRTFIINLLKAKPYELSATSAYRVYNDSINFFFSDNRIKKESWKNIYATRFEQAAEVAWNSGDMETFRRCIRDAAEVRGVFKDEPPSLPEGINDTRPVIYVFDTEKIGIPRANRRELAKFIDELDISDLDKYRSKRDLQIEDIEFTIFEDEKKF